MARLIDRIRANGYQPPGWVEDTSAFMDDCPQVPISAPVIVADNVSEFYYAGTDQEQWGPDDLPNVAPPFAEFWVEVRAPTGIFSCEFGNLRWPRRHPSSWGAHFVAQDIASWDVDERSLVNGYMGGVPSDARWFMQTAMYLEFKRRVPGMVWPGIYGPMLIYELYIGASGAIISDGGGLRCKLPYMERTSVTQKVMDEARSFWHPLMLALSFMNCRGIRQETIVPPPALDKQWQRRHGKPLVQYKVLQINPMREVLRSEGGVDEVGLRRALHICRGHFATYTEDAPLFGHYAGTVWKPQHIRGRLSEGVVIKDYAINAPDEAKDS